MRFNRTRGKDSKHYRVRANKERASTTEKSNSQIEKGGKRIKGGREGVSRRKSLLRETSSGAEVRKRRGGGRVPDAEGDNCRRASLLRCSCKEVLRRDKAPAITIEPRGNSLPTFHTCAHSHALACARVHS